MGRAGLAIALVLVFLFHPLAVGPAAAETVFSDDFNQNDLGKGWNVENLGGSYSLSNGILTLSSDEPSITIYRGYVPQTDSFTVSARVQSRMLAAFALRIHAGSPPISGSTAGAQLEFDTSVENKYFLAAWQPSGGGWTWTTFHGPSAANTWYVLEMKVQRNPFTITYGVYSDSGELLGAFVTTDMGFSYDNIQYICLEAWSASLIYDVDWITITQAGQTTWAVAPWAGLAVSIAATVALVAYVRSRESKEKTRLASCHLSQQTS